MYKVLIIDESGVMCPGESFVLLDDAIEAQENIGWDITTILRDDGRVLDSMGDWVNLHH